jgi:hypothetical protein
MGQRKDIAYVVVERGYEYNDEYYNAESGGTPHNVFLLKKDAEAVALKRNIEFLRNIEEYFFEEPTWHFGPEAYKLLGLDGGDTFMIPKETSDEVLYKVIANWRTPTFYIVECPLS